MNENKVDMFIRENQKYLPQKEIAYLREVLITTDEETFARLLDIEFKDPFFVFLASFYYGCLGVDRFMVGEIEMGILKLLTIGLFGVWTVADWFITFKKAERINFNRIMELIR